MTINHFDRKRSSFSAPSCLLHQVHIHRDLHLRVSNKDPGQGLLRGEVHLPAGPVELAGLQRHPHGVSAAEHDPAQVNQKVGAGS